MNILVLLEHNSTSANYNIAIKIVDELMKNNNVFLGYWESYGSYYGCKYDGENNSFIVQNDCRDNFLRVLAEIKWTNFTDWMRLKYLLLHPKFLFLFLYDKIDSKVEHIKYKNKVERFIKDKKIDIVYGVANPYGIFKLLARLNFNKKYGIQLDPYTFNQSYGLRDIKVRFAVESKVLSNVNKIFTTNLIKEELIRHPYFECYSSKIEEIEFPLIETKLSTNNLNGEGIIKKKKKDEVVFIYAGNFYSTIRNANKLVLLFEKLPDNYFLYVAGNNCSEIRKYDEEIRDRVKILGQLTQDEVRKVYEEADFLISYNNLVKNQVPSKLFECVNTGKPFLNVCQLYDCPTLKYIEDYVMAYTVFTNNIDSQVDGIVKFVDEKKGIVCEKNEVIKKFEACTVEYVTKQIISHVQF